jgi:hypothetical protein
MNQTEVTFEGTEHGYFTLPPSPGNVRYIRFTNVKNPKKILISVGGVPVKELEFTSNIMENILIDFGEFYNLNFLNYKITIAIECDSCNKNCTLIIDGNGLNTGLREDDPLKFPPLQSVWYCETYSTIIIDNNVLNFYRVLDDHIYSPVLKYSV